MLDDKTVWGTNFSCVHAGPMEDWTEFRLEPPDVPLPARGKLFLRGLLGTAGLEMSLNVILPGKGMPAVFRSLLNDSFRKSGWSCLILRRSVAQRFGT